MCNVDLENFLELSKNIYKKLNSKKSIEFKYVPDFRSDKLDKRTLELFDGLMFNGWIIDINNLISEICICFSYAKAFDDELNESKLDKLKIHRDIYINTVLNNLFTFGEKISILFCELMNIENLGKYRSSRYTTFSLNKLNEKFNNKNFSFECIENKNILIEEDFNKMKNYIKELCCIRKNKIFDLRNANNHRENINRPCVLKKEFIKPKNKKIALQNDTNLSAEQFEILRIFTGELIKISPTSYNTSFFNLTKNIEDVVSKTNKATVENLYSMSIFKY